MLTRTFDECYFLNYNAYEDLSLYEIGCQKCHPSYSYGPIIREHYLLHYIMSGDGTLNLDGKNFSVTQNQAFITPPNLLNYYEASASNPWHYIWIQFNGIKAMELLGQAGITKTNPIFIPTSINDKLGQCLFDILDHHEEEYTCIGHLYQLFQIMIHSSSNKPEQIGQADESLKYIRNVINFITEKYSEPIKIQEIADYCGLNRSYLTRLFKHATSYSPQEYLILYRVNKAKQLLDMPEIPIQHIAYSVGYNDPFTFSKLFKRETGLSPSEYREKNSSIPPQERNAFLLRQKRSFL